MKYHRITLLIIFLTLLCVSVSATTTIIPPGGEIFIGEEGLDISLAVSPPHDAIAFFPPGSSPGRDMPLDVRKVERKNFSAIPSLYSDRTGPWYQWDSRRGTSGSVAFVLREPRISVRIMQMATMEDVSSGTIPRGSSLIMQLDTNTGSVASRPGYNPSVDGIVDLLIETPGGGVLTGVETRSGPVSLTGITPYGSLQSVPAVQTGGWNTGATSPSGGYLYGGGTYTVQPRFAFNRVNENLRADEKIGIIRGASVTLGSEQAKITARNDQVVRGNSFSVTISGAPGMPVYLWIDGARKSGAPGDQPPMILFAQEGVSQDNPGGPYLIGKFQPSSEGGRNIKDIVPNEPYSGVKYYAMVTPDRDGKRTIELRTSQATDDTRYTVKIESPSPVRQTTTDELRITVVKGAISAVSEKQIYAIGEEVKLSGYNTESCETYLFITGPNLPSAGGRLDNPRQAVRNNVPSSFTIASGDCETFDYRLNTGNLGIDAGTYTIYAVPSPVDRNNLGSIPYQTIPLTLRRPYVSLTTQTTTVARGDSLILTGMSAGAPRSGVAVWTFGKNYFRYDTAPIERDGFFEYKIPAFETGRMVAGQYTVIIQHPMGNGEFDIWPDGMRNLVMGNTPWPNSPIFRIGGAGSLNGPEAANALITALNSAFIDDTYTMYNIRVDSPKIMVDESSFIQDGSGSIVISGTTNLAAGTRLLIEITDNRFIPTRKSDRDSSYGYSGTAEIWQGDSSRFFTFTVPSGRLEAGEYRLIVQAVESEAMTTELLTIITEPVSRLDIPAVGNQTTNTTLPELPNVSGMITPAGYQNETNLTTSPSPLETIVNPDESGKPTVKPEQLTVMPTVSEGEKAVYQSLSPVLLILLGVTLGIIIAGIVAFILSKRAKADMEPVEEPISDNTVDDENTKTADELTRSDKGDDISNSELPANERDN